jgi:hypothetical protein
MRSTIVQIFYDNSEQVNLDYIQKALALYDKAFSLPSVVQSIEKLEGICKKYSPYDSIHKLAGIVRRAKDTPVIVWVFATITDLVVSKKYHGLDFPARWLLGDPNTGRGGAVDLFIMKHRMLEYLISTQLDTFAFPRHVKEKMREVLAIHDNYRKFLSPIVKSDDAPRACDDAQSACVVAEPKPDLTWRCNWSRSAIMYLSFVERCCYGDDFDTSLRTARKMGKSALDVLQYESITLAMKDVHDMQTKEQEGERKTLCLSGAGPDQATGVAVDPVAAGSDPATPSAAAGDQQENSLDQRLQLEAERMVNSKCAWLIEPESVLEVKTAIMSSNAGRSEGRDGMQYVLIVYDYKQACEPKTSPATRVATLRDNRMSKCIAGSIDARRTHMGRESVELMPGDMYLLFDGSRSGNMAKLKSGFVTDAGEALPKAERRLTLIYSEEGIARRRQIVRGTGSVKQQEGLMMITPLKPRGGAPAL